VDYLDFDRDVIGKVSLNHTSTATGGAKGILKIEDLGLAEAEALGAGNLPDELQRGII